MSDATDVAVLIEGAKDSLGLLARVDEGEIRVEGTAGEIIWETGSVEGDGCRAEVPLRIEAETVATIGTHGSHARLVAELTVAILLAVYRKRLVVDVYRETSMNSYQELAERNRRLADMAAGIEEQVRVKTRELDEVHAQLARDEKVVAIGRLSAGLAHELNTPLACVRSNLQRLSEWLPLDGESEEMVRESLNMTDRAATIVRDLRGFSHVDDVGLVKVDLNEEIDRILGRLQVPDGLVIEKSYGQLRPVEVDGRLITVALLHLLENARDAVDGPGRIRIATVMEDESVVVLITDDGLGIPPEIMRHVFDPFFTTKEVGKGTGLGLTVAQNIARAHGGELTLGCPAFGGTIARLSIRCAAEEGTV